VDLPSVLGNLVASLLAFAAGLSFRTTVHYWRTSRPRRRALGFTPAQQISIVVGDRTTSDQPGPGLFESDVYAATTVLSHVRILWPKAKVTVTTATALDERAGLERDLVVVGGPKTNRAFRIIAKRLSLPFSFDLDADLPVLVRAADGHEFPLSVDDGGRTTLDHGLVVVAPNPFRPGCRVWLLAGCGTLGTMSAAKVLSEPELGLIPREMVTAGHGALVVQTEVIEGYHTQPRIVAVDVDGVAVTR